MTKKTDNEFNKSADDKSVPQTPQPAQPFVTATSRNPKTAILETGDEKPSVPEKGEK